MVKKKCVCCDNVAYVSKRTMLALCMDCIEKNVAIMNRKEVAK